MFSVHVFSIKCNRSLSARINTAYCAFFSPVKTTSGELLVFIKYVYQKSGNVAEFVYKGVGRKVSRGGTNGKKYRKIAKKNSTIKPLTGGGGATEKKTENIKKKTPKNSTFKPLSTIFVPCLKTQVALPPAADAHVCVYPYLTDLRSCRQRMCNHQTTCERQSCGFV